MEHIYEDIEYLTGAEGVMTHQLPNAARAMEPWLRSKIVDVRFWDDKYDTSHVGEFDIQPMTKAEKNEMFRRYNELPSLLAGKQVIPVDVD